MPYPFRFGAMRALMTGARRGYRGVRRSFVRARPYRRPSGRYSYGKAFRRPMRKYAQYKRYYKRFDYGNPSPGRKGKIGKMATKYPVFRFAKDYVEIIHREYIFDLISSSVAGQFRVDRFLVNPGEMASFPWLAEVCSTTFEEYEFMGCVYEFRSFSSDALNSSQTALGAVIVAVDYDASDEGFATRQEMENTDDSFSAKPSASFEVPLNCSRRNNPLKTLYIRDGSEASDVDPKFYDLASLSIASTGCPGTSVNLGSLYCTYRVRLKKPIMETPGLFQRMLKFRVTNNVGNTQPLGASSADRGVDFDNMNSTISSASNSITLNRRYVKVGMKFIFIYGIYSTGGGAITTPSFTATGADQENWFQNLTQDNLFAGQVNQGVLVEMFEVNQTGATSDVVITLGNIVVSGSPIVVDVLVLQVNGVDWEA